MPFGIASGPAYFSMVIQEVLEPMLYKGVINYLDDIAIYGRTVEEVMTRLEIVLRLLQHANLKIKISKCHFFMKEIELLGFKISERGIEPKLL